MQELYKKVILLINNHKYKPLWYVFLFMVITYSFHLIWRKYSIEINSVKIISIATNFLTNQVFIWSEWFNKNILHLNFYIVNPRTFIFPSVNGYIEIVEGCSGMKQMYQVFFLFILFPGPWKHKIWFIPITFIVMFLTNVFRIIALSLILIHYPNLWDFSHTWILRPFFYVIIFGLWVIWIDFFVTPPEQRKKWFLKNH